MLGTLIVLGILLLGLFCVRIRVTKHRSDIVTVLKAVPNEDLVLMRNQFQRFKQNWLKTG